MELLFHNSYATLESAVSDFLQRHRILSTKLLNQVFLRNRLILSFKQSFGRYQHLVEKYCVRFVQITRNDIGNANMTSLFRFVNKRGIDRRYNLISTCAGECE